MSTRQDDLGNGEGKVLYDEQVALSRDEQGTLHTVSSVCTHLGCDVEWNGEEKTWDCPCHGSRFGPTGDVLRGPATARCRRPRSPSSSGDGDQEPGLFGSNGSRVFPRRIR